MSSNTNPAAVVLLSGGLDSATVLAIAKSKGFSCHCLTMNYGQRHSVELEAAKRVASALGAVSHQVVELDLTGVGGSALTADIEVPKDGVQEGIPVTYVPARNTIMLSVALGLAEVLNADAIFAGMNAVDYSGYPDCRPEYIAAFQKMANLATKRGVEGNPIRIETPIIHMSKAEIIRTGVALGVDYGLTHSCYDPVDGFPCGACDSCRIRAAGFAEAGLPDPALNQR